MMLWIGLGLGAFIAVSLLVAFVFARVVATLNGDMIELLEDRVTGSPSGVGERKTPGRRLSQTTPS
jgi:hypothetical protein